MSEIRCDPDNCENLKIEEIRVENLTSNCVTDKNPLISFSMSSDIPNTRLEKAIIRIGDWEKESTDQVCIVYDGFWSRLPLIGYNSL